MNPQIMTRAEWHEKILRPCLKNGTCQPYDQGAAWCRLDDGTVRRCDYYFCPWVTAAYICKAIPGHKGMI